jgi:hypothetical protein
MWRAMTQTPAHTEEDSNKLLRALEARVAALEAASGPTRAISALRDAYPQGKTFTAREAVDYASSAREVASTLGLAVTGLPAILEELGLADAKSLGQFLAAHGAKKCGRDHGSQIWAV